MNNERAFIGIDPGVTGAACMITEGDRVEIHDFVTERQAAATIKRWQKQCQVELAVIEKVLSHPKNGHRQAFTFGSNFGFWKGVILGAGIKPELVTPQKWQRAVCVPADGKGKGKSIRAAARLMPGMASRHIYLAKHHDRGDALCMAYHAFQIWELNQKREKGGEINAGKRTKKSN